MKIEQIHIRTTEEQKQKAEELANRENRSTSNYIINLIEKEYKNLKKEGKIMNNLENLTNQFEEKFSENRTNVGYIVDEIEYIFGKYIKEDRNIYKDIDNDDILDNVLYIAVSNYNENKNDYYKIGLEDLEGEE